MSSLSTIPELQLPSYPLLDGYKIQLTPPDDFSFAICPMCSKVQEDILVHKKIKLQKMIFCSTNCTEIFRNNVVKVKSNSEKKEEPKPNAMMLAYTHKQTEKQVSDNLQRNW